MTEGSILGVRFLQPGKSDREICEAAISVSPAKGGYYSTRSSQVQHSLAVLYTLQRAGVSLTHDENLVDF